MRKPGPDTLVKIASLGGGGLAVAKSWQDTHNNRLKTKKEMEELKASEGEWQKWKAENERKKKKIDKAVAKKKMKKSKGEGYHEK